MIHPTPLLGPPGGVPESIIHHEAFRLVLWTVARYTEPSGSCGAAYAIQGQRGVEGSS
jgi:hypothetical protein